MNRLRKKKTTSQTSWTDSGSTPSGSGLQPDVAGRTHRSRVSLASSTASTSSSTSSLKLTRIDVVLFGGEKIAVPVEKSTTFAELQYEALKRARVAIPQGREVLVRLDGRNGARAYGGDSLEGVLFSDGARAGRWTVWLEWEKAYDDHASDPIERKNEVYIRWITAARALDFPRFCDVPVDRTPVNITITIAELRKVALERVYQGSNTYEAPLSRNVKLEVFLMPCCVRTTDDKTMTLADLGLSGSIQKPLDVFLVPAREGTTDSRKPHAIWPFEFTERGVATFLTCLKFLFLSQKKELSHRRLLEVLFHTFHFPPALEAYQIVREEKQLVPEAVNVLATCFRELALRMAPPTLLGLNQAAALEASRQLFAWIDIESEKNSGDSDDPETALVRTITLQEILEPSCQKVWVPGKRTEIVEFIAAGRGVQNLSSDHPRGNRRVQVTAPANCGEDLRLLAMAMWGQYEDTDVYVDFSGNIEKPLHHRRRPIPNQAQFRGLMVEANSKSQFQMTPPASIDDHYETCITLSKNGFVSLFNVMVGQFKDINVSTWNAISGIEILSGEAGKKISNALEPIIRKRKTEGTWDIDDWNYINAGATEQNLSEPQEAIVICLDLSSSMGERMGREWVRGENSFTKLTEVKQVFENVLARMSGYHLWGNYIGVVAFSSASRVRIRSEISKLSNANFQDLLGNESSSGCTALWDAINTAKDMLTRFKAIHHKTKLRIIALTDGQDNDSTVTPEILCRGLYNAGIVLDSLAIGTAGSSTTEHLFRISKHTGGYAFNPTSRLLLFQIFLLETFLDISARPDIVRVPIGDYESSVPKRADMQNIFDIPPCRKSPFDNGPFMKLPDFLRKAALAGVRGIIAPSVSSSTSSWRKRTEMVDFDNMSTGSSTLASSRPPSISSTSSTLSSTSSTMSSTSSRSVGRKYMREVSHMRDNPLEYMDVYVSEREMTYWKVVMEGPRGTPYEGGRFLMSVHLTDEFPEQAPIVRFLTPMLHPNITKHGRVCHGIFQKDWLPTYHVQTVLQYMHDLLKNPEANDSVDELATLKFWTDQESANKEIKKYVEHFARKSREDWRYEILEK